MAIGEQMETSSGVCSENDSQKQQQRADCVSAHASVFALQRENEELRRQLAALKQQQPHVQLVEPNNPAYSVFTASEMQRYGRQMLVKDFGVAAQEKLHRSRALIVGVGGLGCPAAMYLASMGIGTLCLVDADVVDRSNLHRQVLHDESTLHMPKVDSAYQKLLLLNPHVTYVKHPERLTMENGERLVQDYDVVIDASDNPATRYLLNAVCVLQRKPLVSGSALGMEGQVTVFPFDTSEASFACYQCLYPTPSSKPMSCAANGVLGVVPGVIGCLQAMEAIKVLTQVGQPMVGVQCFYDAFEGRFRHLRLKSRSKECAVCRYLESQVTMSLQELMTTLSTSTPAVCLSTASTTKSLAPEHQIDAVEFAKKRQTAANSNQQVVVLDVRARHQFDMVHFPEAINIPLRELKFNCQLAEKWKAQQAQVYVICRRGNDSISATKWLLNQELIHVQNVIGGYTAFARDVPEERFPMY